MKRALMTLVFSGLLLNSSGAMASMIGQCDALAAKFTGAEQQVANGINVEGNCTALAGRLFDFGSAGCVPLLDSGQLYISHLRLDHSLIQNACTALNCVCGFEIVECVGVVDCP
jgi:hypothetical protein